MRVSHCHRRDVVRWRCSRSLLSRRPRPIRPRRVVSFNVCADQLVVALADPGPDRRAVALCAPIPRSSVVAEQGAPTIRCSAGTAEAMVPLKPDLVLVGPWDRPLTQRLLHVLGFRIVNVPLINDLTTGIAQIREIAKLLGHPERGEALIAEIEAARGAAGRGAASASRRARCWSATAATPSVPTASPAR